MTGPRCVSFALLHVAWYQKKNFPEEVIRTSSENFYTDYCLKYVDIAEKVNDIVHDLCRLLEIFG